MLKIKITDFKNITLNLILFLSKRTSVNYMEKFLKETINRTTVIRKQLIISRILQLEDIVLRNYSCIHFAINLCIICKCFLSTSTKTTYNESIIAEDIACHKAFKFIKYHSRTSRLCAPSVDVCNFFLETCDPIDSYTIIWDYSRNILVLMSKIYEFRFLE